MKKVPSHGYVRITGPAAGRPADRSFPDNSPTIPKRAPPVPYWKNPSLVGFPKKNGHQKAPRRAMLVKMAGFPLVKRVDGA